MKTSLLFAYIKIQHHFIYKSLFHTSNSWLVFRFAFFSVLPRLSLLTGAHAIPTSYIIRWNASVVNDKVTRRDSSQEHILPRNSKFPKITRCRFLMIASCMSTIESRWLLMLSNRSRGTLMSYNNRVSRRKQPTPGHFRQSKNRGENVCPGSGISGHLSVQQLVEAGDYGL